MAEAVTPIRAKPYATIVRAFGDGNEYPLGLGWGEMLALEQARSSALLPLLSRLANGMWNIEDAPAVIRLGLIGAGMAPAKAIKLTNDYVARNLPGETWPLAVEVLSLAIFGETKAAANAAPAPEAKSQAKSE